MQLGTSEALSEEVVRSRGKFYEDGSWGRGRGFPDGLVVKNPPTKETWVWSLGGEDLLEEGMATHSSVLAWRIPWTEEPGGLRSMASQSQT